MDHQNLFDINYCFRLLTESIFEAGHREVVFDLFLADSDLKLTHFHIYDNLWRETILLDKLSKHQAPRIAPIVSFG